MKKARTASLPLPPRPFENLATDYAAPIHLAKRIRGAVEEPGGASIIASRVDFERVNARLPEGLRSATPGHLSSESFSHLLLHGWLPQQSRKVGPRRGSMTLARV